MSPLSSDELREIRDELNAGTTPTVWFTGSAIGVPEGRSGKVISLGEPAEGDFIQVRPAGSKDVLSFSAAEVTKVKPPRKRAAAPEPAKPAPSAAKPKTVGATLPRVTTAAQAKPAQSAAKPATPAKQAEAAKPSAEEKPAARRKPRPPKAVGGATVTLTADDDGQWSVEVSTPKKRVLKPTPVQAGAVAQAAKALHDDVAAAVEPLIEAAREQQRVRVEQLRAELAAAEAALNDLRS
ncbi:hypothetical protein SAMN05421805_11831 [Saccharopolyspora antimicrobica]|uniref:Cell wall anchor protein n=1 Tax=Saccharopolyspora antimicrobica TaxID=455193 RepID=A0A1I5IAM5_9PSEU|nr:DUF6319 family protein [Saccharopolyspora antimicrobica]RKT85567.1 hypothetical protein ATL45_3914 [Saccharopolyspora antimicrobica]SFO57603.1 hypothetical protein SAMN05421805_11831 [Saccharopolyspora antimicrobica]